MRDWDTVEAVLGQVQLLRAAPQPHIQRSVRPETVLRIVKAIDDLCGWWRQSRCTEPGW
jgi:hypothetical protein